MSGRAAAAWQLPVASEQVIWHDLECGVYGADLELWAELARAPGDGPRASVLELGTGTGRVALELARRGHPVAAVEREPELLDALVERARARGIAVAATLGDARELDLGRSFDLVLAPMQFAQLLDRRGRAALLAAAERHLSPGGVLAFALTARMSDAPLPTGASPLPLPDVREIDGWIFSSQPLPTGSDRGGTVVRRLRQIVSPGGELRDHEHEVRLEHLAPAELEAEARVAGLFPRGRRDIPSTGEHVGSSVVILGRETPEDPARAEGDR